MDTIAIEGTKQEKNVVRFLS